MPYRVSAMFVTHGMPSHMSYSVNVSTFFLNVLVVAEGMLVTNNIYFRIHKTLVAISIILISSQFNLIPKKCIIY